MHFFFSCSCEFPGKVGVLHFNSIVNHFSDFPIIELEILNSSDPVKMSKGGHQSRKKKSVTFVTLFYGGGGVGGICHTFYFMLRMA